MCDLRGMAGKLRSGGAQSVVASIACWALILACAGQSRAQGQTAPQLQGVYAHVDLEFAINEYFRQNGGVTPAPCPPPGTPDLHAYLQNIYTGLLKNTAVAGLALGAHWCLIGTTGDGVNDWSYTDEAFAAAAAANKNVQLLITPGVDSPSWLFLVGQSCDPVIKAELPNPEYQYCDWVTFKTLPEFRATSRQHDVAIAVQPHLCWSVESVPRRTQKPVCRQFPVQFRVRLDLGRRTSFGVTRDDPANNRQQFEV